ncbi:uncharacterized protein LOC119832336 [Zerene cesonia]|uniref:uncharacterized protein LOC119832336 n=1 Tax=Zerene cesonia TaxID=33412 RepID=UPI0018E56C99|nr:uncharacterized protein LOC119832336 [Zerene cesonia]
MLMLITSILITVCLVLIYRFLNTKNKPPIFGVYQQKSKTYWFKFLFMYTILKIRQLKVHLNRLFAIELGRSSDGVMHVQEHDVNLEKLYNLGDNPKAVDGTYFNGMSKSGAALICGLARRPQRICDAFLFLKIEGEEVLLTPSLPDTYLKKSSEDNDSHEVQGLSVANFIPMRTWKLSYNGEMKHRDDSNKKIKVEANLTWSANFPPFEYDSQMSPKSMASDMAREPWSADYFKLLKKFHQTHYEQVGFIKGTVLIDDKIHELNMPCVRDRSFGPLREWRNFHRYVYHFIFLDNGDFVAVGSISQPSILSHLTVGYFCRMSDQSVISVDSSNFQLYQHGENQQLPKDYGFIFEAGGESYVVKVQAQDEVTFFIGKDKEAKFYEKWCDIEVNGVKGQACVEWQYNNVVPI